MADVGRDPHERPSSRTLLLVVPSNLRVGGGQEQDLSRLASELSRTGFRVRVADIDAFLREKPRFSDEAVAQQLGAATRTRIEAIPGVRRLTSIPTLRGARRLRDLMASSDLVITAPYYGEDAVIALLGRLARRPVVVSQNNTFLHRVRGNPREALQDVWNRLVGVCLLRSVAGVRVPSGDEQATLASFGVTRTMVLYAAGHAPPPEGEVPAPELPALTPTPGGPGPGAELRVLVAGRMTPQKGVATVAEVLGRLRARPDGLSRFRFSFAGTDHLPPELDRFVREVPDRVVNLGFIPSGLEEVFRRTDLLLMPSLYESLGMTAIEAIRHGVPVVASDVSGLREVVRPGDTGWLATAQDPESFVRALDASLELKTNEPAAWLELKGRCRADYDRRFGPRPLEAQYARFVGWLRELAEGPGGARSG